MAIISRAIRLARPLSIRAPLLSSSCRASQQRRTFLTSQKRWQSNQQGQRPLGFEPDTSRRDFWVKFARRVLGYTIAIYVAGYIRDYYFNDQKIRALNERRLKDEALADGDYDKALDRAGEEEVFVVPEEQPEDAFFLSLWLPSRVEKTMRERFYKRDDPAYRSMLDLYYDTKAMRLLKERYCEDLRQYIASYPAIKKQVGDLKVTKYWLDIKPITTIPEEYERWGIEFNSEGDAYMLPRKMTAHQKNRMTHFLWPKAVVLAVGDYWKVLFRDGWRSAQSIYASSVSSFPSAGLPSLPTPTNTSAPAPPSLTPDESSSASSSSAETAPIFSTIADLSESTLTHFRHFYKRGSTFSNANMAFFRRLSRSQDYAMKVPERGDMLVEGSVELVGARVELKYAVRGYYNAQKKEFRVSALPIYQGPNWRNIRRPG